MHLTRRNTRLRSFTNVVFTLFALFLLTNFVDSPFTRVLAPVSVAAQTVAAATDKMFEAARLRPGMRVLDLAAGTGDQALLAAQIVGPAGSVLATDISPSMLAVAEESARDAGLSNIETLVADASRVELPDEHFDAAICRFGLMFLPDLQAALERAEHGRIARQQLVPLPHQTLLGDVAHVGQATMHRHQMQAH